MYHYYKTTEYTYSAINIAYYCTLYFDVSRNISEKIKYKIIFSWFIRISKFAIFQCRYEWSGGEGEGMAKQATALLMSRYIVPYVTTRSMLYPQPVSLAGYSNE